MENVYDSGRLFHFDSREIDSKLGAPENQEDIKRNQVAKGTSLLNQQIHGVILVMEEAV